MGRNLGSHLFRIVVDLTNKWHARRHAIRRSEPKLPVHMPKKSENETSSKTNSNVSKAFLDISTFVWVVMNRSVLSLSFFQSADLRRRMLACGVLAHYAGSRLKLERDDVIVDADDGQGTHMIYSHNDAPENQGGCGC